MAEENTVTKLNDSPKCLGERLARLERKVKSLEERLDALPTMEDMKRVFATKEDLRRFATKDDFGTLDRGISETHNRLGLHA